MMQSNTSQARILWIDWMKTMGMFFIILGHFFSIGYTYIYVFSVPLFFVISGFLTRKEEQHAIFWKKLFFNLIVPMGIICLALYFWKVHISTLGFMSLPAYIIGASIGSQECLDTCWFVYTLIILKIIFQYTPQDKHIHFFIFISLTITAYILNGLGIQGKNAILNITVAYQPFIIGYYLKQWRNQLCSSWEPALEVFLLLVSIILVWVCGHFNGDVWMYRNGYGNYFSLYLIGTIAGTTHIYILCKHLPARLEFIATTISKGNILILGFQMVFIYICRQYFPDKSLLDTLFSLLILLLFIPIIIFAEHYLPYLLGKR